MRQDEDEPLDLLSKKALGNISSTKPLRQRQVPKLSKAKRNEDGKLVLGGPDSDEEPALRSKKGSKRDTTNDEDVLMDIDESANAGSLEDGINAYVDAIRGRDAAKRGQKGKLKFSNKRTDEDDEMDVDSDNEAKSARKEKSGSGMGRGAHNKSQRRGLGADKMRGASGEAGIAKVMKSRSPKMKGKGVGRWTGPGAKR